MAQKLYSTAQAAAAAGISRQTLHTWITEGKVMAPEMIGNTRVWTESQVAALRRMPRQTKPRKRT